MHNLNIFFKAFQSQPFISTCCSPFAFILNHNIPQVLGKSWKVLPLFNVLIFTTFNSPSHVFSCEQVLWKMSLKEAQVEKENLCELLC